MTMGTRDTAPPPRGSISPPLLLPMRESMAAKKEPMAEGMAGSKNESQTVTLRCGHRHHIGRYSIMYFGVIDDKGMIDVRRDGFFMGEIYKGNGESGHVDAPMEGKRISVDVISSDSREAKVTISISGI